MAADHYNKPTDIISSEDMQKLAQTLDTVLPELTETGARLGFALVIFNFGPNGNIQYASNAERVDMIAVFRELLGKWASDGSSVQN